MGQNPISLVLVPSGSGSSGSICAASSIWFWFQIVQLTVLQFGLRGFPEPGGEGCRTHLDAANDKQERDDEKTDSGA